MRIVKKFPSDQLHPYYISDEDLLAKIDKLKLRGLKSLGKIEVTISKGKKMRHASMFCTYCCKTRTVNVSSLIRGKAKGCRCSMNIKHGANCRTNINKNEKASIFGDRCDAIYQRCNNPAGSILFKIRRSWIKIRDL